MKSEQLRIFNLNDYQNKLLFEYFELISEYNKVLNLTGIDDIDGVYNKHYLDSLLLDNIIPISVSTIADIGTGMGVPGIILAIYYPNKDIYLVEPLTKRCKFLEVVVEKLKLENVTIINGRAEDLSIKVDLSVSRAVANMNMLLELCYGVVRDNGYILVMKGKNANSEKELARSAIDKLKLILEDEKVEFLNGNEDMRVNYLFKKGKHISKYPRHFSQIKKKPL